MKNNISYNTIEGAIIADIKPVKSKHANHGLRVAQFDKTGRFLTLYASAKDAAIAIAKEKKQISVNLFMLELLKVVLQILISKLYMVISGDMLMKMEM